MSCATTSVSVCVVKVAPPAVSSSLISGEVLDDAVVHDGDAIDEMRMGVAFGRRAMRCPAGMGDADHAVERLFGKTLLQVEQLAFGAATGELAVDDGGDAGGIVAAIFKALQGIDKPARNRLVSNDTDNSAHGLLRFLQDSTSCLRRAFSSQCNTATLTFDCKR